jgi:hypothetical protein
MCEFDIFDLFEIDSLLSIISFDSLSILIIISLFEVSSMIISIEVLAILLSGTASIALIITKEKLFFKYFH